MLKKGVVIKSGRIKPLNFDCETIILFTLFLCGVIIGAFLIKNLNEEVENAFSTILSNYISAKSESSFMACFSGLALILILFIVIEFLFGLCAVGTPLVWLVPILFGVFCSSYVSLMLINYGLKGLFYFVMVDLCPYAITTATLVKCCCESTKVSINLFSCLAGNNTLRSNNLLKDYILNYLILCMPVIIGAIISAFCFRIFQGLFIFS